MARAAPVSGKGTCVDHSTPWGTTHPGGRHKRLSGGQGPPPLCVLRFPCHWADLNNSAMPGLLGTIVFSEGKSVARSAC